MTTQEILSDIHALEEELLDFERRYGVRSEIFHAAYSGGEEPADEGWLLDFGEWASIYRTWLARQAAYRDACPGVLVPGTEKVQPRVAGFRLYR